MTNTLARMESIIGKTISDSSYSQRFVKQKSKIKNKEIVMEVPLITGMKMRIPDFLFPATTTCATMPVGHPI